MSNDETGDRIQKLYREMRSADGRRMPAFDRLISSGAARPVFAIRWIRVAALATSVVVLSISVAMLQEGREPETRTAAPQIDLKDWETVSGWEASTDSLLTVSNAPWGAAFVAPTDSWMSTSSTGSDETQVN
jgi:hypothetical protein